jgi:hypothetical protein
MKINTAKGRELGDQSQFSSEVTAKGPEASLAAQKEEGPRVGKDPPRQNTGWGQQPLR